MLCSVQLYKIRADIEYSPSILLFLKKYIDIYRYGWALTELDLVLRLTTSIHNTTHSIHHRHTYTYTYTHPFGLRTCRSSHVTLFHMTGSAAYICDHGSMYIVVLSWFLPPLVANTVSKPHCTKIPQLCAGMCIAAPCCPGRALREA